MVMEMVVGVTMMMMMKSFNQIGQELWSDLLVKKGEEVTHYNKHWAGKTGYNISHLDHKVMFLL